MMETMRASGRVRPTHFSDTVRFSLHPPDSRGFGVRNLFRPTQKRNKFRTSKATLSLI